MEKLKRGHFILIISVVILTVYNVLPTLIYYSKPLSKPVSSRQAQQIARSAFSRVDHLQKESLDWIGSFAKHIGVKPKSISPIENFPELIEVSFHRPAQAQKFKALLPRAGAMIPFTPAQLSLAPDVKDNSTKVVVERRVHFNLNDQPLDQLVTFVPQKENNLLTQDYQTLIVDRFSELARGFGGQSPQAQFIHTLTTAAPRTNFNKELLELAQNIQSYVTHFGEQSPITKRYFQSFSQSLEKPDLSVLVDKMERYQKDLSKKISDQKEDSEKQKLQKDETLLSDALGLIKKHRTEFETQSSPLLLKEISEKVSFENPHLALGSLNPFVESLSLDFENGALRINLHPDVKEIQSSLLNTDQIRAKKERLNQLIINEIAKVSKQSNEKISPIQDGYQVEFNQLDDTQGYLLLDLAKVASSQISRLKNRLQTHWNPESPEFSGQAFPIWDHETYASLEEGQKKFGLLLYAPILDQSEPHRGFNKTSLYVVAKGLNPILQKYQQFSNLELAENFKEEFITLQNIFQQMGYQYSFLASESQFSKEFDQDFVFECPNYFADLLAATREDFAVSGNMQHARLELSDLEQRILTTNKIETQMHEELIKWKEDYQASLVDIQDTQSRFLIPPPTQNIFLSNFMLSAREYFRGDNRKVLKWGLDLSGGKSILIGLKDHQGRPITDKVELSQGVNELTQRVNKMGLSEVDIRTEGSHIALDFPSSKGLSASELIKGSSMSFHVVNEKFASKDSKQFVAMQRFLQEVWNEATITNRKDAEGINAIAWKQLGGSPDTLEITPRSEHAKELFAHGFRLAHPQKTFASNQFDTDVTSIGVYRGEDYSSWRGQTHPLIPIFSNFALEGADIENVRTSYDPSQGNTLVFGVKGQSHKGDFNPREIFSNWTTPFGKDRIMGSAYEKYSMGRGWRMAIVLNGQVINDPQLNQGLRDNVQVSGGFTQHEAQKLSADLKAGSLSFTPQILSVENVSADLGQAERVQGIVATVIALLLVIVVMVAYYRFSGIVASVAVLFNLLIMWGTLQNLQATLTLSGIAGIILTVGMAVDANVLVFERIREELKKTQSLGAAIATGYKKAFSAIFDSNITTIIAAVILLNFDAGPIKGLAITLTIGIASSMFTALFMTRAFFSRWVRNTKAKTLNMANWIKVKSFNFLKHARLVSTVSLLIIVAGAAITFFQNKSIVGMDFTGGYSVNVELEQSPLGGYRKNASLALIEAGAKSTDFQIRELSNPWALRIQLSSALDEIERPFGQMSSEDSLSSDNPRLNWLVSALAAKDLKLTSQSQMQLEKNWSQMSGQLSKTTRNNALMGLSLAVLFILIYISFRYEVKYAISAILCILHDILITLALIAILHSFGVALQINMQIIAALMTIIGYSLNDTIIVFDRIREDKKLYPNKSFYEVINHSIGVTLNRTIMTSLTTFVVLLALVVLGGAKIFDFSLVMSLGVILGTLSSLFVAPLFLHFMDQKDARKGKAFGFIKRSPIS